MKCHTVFVINLHHTHRQAAPIAFLHTMTVCSMYLLPARLSSEAFSACGGKQQKQDGLCKNSSLHHLRVLTELLSRVSKTEQEHFPFHSGSSFSELPWFSVGSFPRIQCEPSFRSHLHFQLCQSAASSRCCKGVVWSSFCCLCHVEALSWSHSMLLARENRHSKLLISIWTCG